MKFIPFSAPQKKICRKIRNFRQIRILNKKPYSSEAKMLRASLQEFKPKAYYPNIIGCVDGFVFIGDIVYDFV